MWSRLSKISIFSNYFLSFLLNTQGFKILVVRFKKNCTPIRVSHFGTFSFFCLKNVHTMVHRSEIHTDFFWRILGLIFIAILHMTIFLYIWMSQNWWDVWSSTPTTHTPWKISRIWFSHSEVCHTWQLACRMRLAFYSGLVGPK